MLPPGWQPYSLVFRAEDFPTDDDGDPLPMYNEKTGLPNGKLLYVSYQGLEPVSAFLGIAASTAQYQTMFYDNSSLSQSNPQKDDFNEWSHH